MPFASNISTDIKLSKAQISKIILCGGSFGSWLDNLGKKALTDLAFPLTRDNLRRLVSNLASNATNKFERKMSRKEAVRVGKGFNILFSNEYMNDIIKTINLLEDFGVLIAGVTETVKHEIKKTRRWVSWSFFSTFGCFNSATSDFFSSKICKWKKS